MTSSPSPIASALSEYPVAIVYEAMSKTGDVSPEIRPLWSGLKLAGRAVTVKTFPGEMQAVFRAISVAMPGDVLVIDGGGTIRSTVFGGTAMEACLQRGIVGAVINAACRDTSEIIERRFPVFALGASLRGVIRGHQGWIDVPIALGDTPVNPGDIVIGDDDGVLIVPQARQADAVDLVRRQFDREQHRDARIRAGEPVMDVLGLPSRS